MCIRDSTTIRASMGMYLLCKAIHEQTDVRVLLTGEISDAVSYTHLLPYGTKDVDDDYGDKRIVPGFMDIHCHGAYEFDTNDANEDGLR